MYTFAYHCITKLRCSRNLSLQGQKLLSPLKAKFFFLFPETLHRCYVRSPETGIRKRDLQVHLYTFLLANATSSFFGSSPGVSNECAVTTIVARLFWIPQSFSQTFWQRFLCSLPAICFQREPDCPVN